jgi:hypothetical protein
MDIRSLILYSSRVTEEWHELGQQEARPTTTRWEEPQ